MEVKELMIIITSNDIEAIEKMWFSKETFKKYKDIWKVDLAYYL